VLEGNIVGAVGPTEGCFVGCFVGFWVEETDGSMEGLNEGSAVAL
jgi:hypothetical protein